MMLLRTPASCPPLLLALNPQIYLSPSQIPWTSDYANPPPPSPIILALISELKVSRPRPPARPLPPDIFGDYADLLPLTLLPPWRVRQVHTEELELLSVSGEPCPLVLVTLVRPT
jgi:hypothetical protein